MNSAHIPPLLTALALIVAVACVFGAAARKIHQPTVVGEIIAGILLGPTLFDGAVADALFPAEIQPLLGALANIGLALFMFSVGAEVDLGHVRRHGRTAITVAVASTAAPFALGVALALHLAPRHPGVDGPGFVLFIGVAVSITAFPVLARILADRGRGRTRSPIEGLALSSAAAADVLMWSVLAAIVAMVGAGARSLWSTALVIPFALVMLFVVRPGLRRLHDGWGATEYGTKMLALTVAGLLASGAATELMGIHFIFGAFLFGLVMPRSEQDAVREAAWKGIDRIGGVLLLPVYFVVAGMSVDLSAIDVPGLGELGLILAVSIGGKITGTFLAARIHRIDWHEATVLGVLMNTRGLTELIVLTIGLPLGLLDRRLYSLFVLMALLTTAMTGPALWLLTRRLRGPASDRTADSQSERPRDPRAGEDGAHPRALTRPSATSRSSSR